MSGLLGLERLLSIGGSVLLGALLLLTALPASGGQSRPADVRTPQSAFDSVVALTEQPTQEGPTGKLDLDVQVMIWAPTALLPVPFLRLTHTPGRDIQSDVSVWWLHPASVPADRLPTDRRCSAPAQRTPVCVANIEVAGVDWGAVLVDVFASRACSLWYAGPLRVVADAGDLVVRVYEPGTGRYEEFMCNAPAGDSRPGAGQAARVMDVLSKAALAARQ
jgi:hypothetical protein